jgi:hypothetical protein
LRPRLLVGIALLAIAVSLGVTYGVHAVRSTRGPAAQDPLAMLDLSSEQKRQIGAHFRLFHPKLLEKQAAVDTQRARLAGLLADRESGDDETIQDCLAEISRLEAEVDREVVRDLLLLKPYLTREQELKLFHYIELRHSSLEKAR